MKTFLGWVQQYREILFPLAGLGLLWLAILFVGHLTGRSLDDPGVIVAYLYNAMGVLIVFAIAGVVQSHLFGFRARNRDRVQGPGAALRDDVYDAVITLLLVGGIGYAVLFR